MNYCRIFNYTLIVIVVWGPCIVGVKNQRII